MPEPHKGRHLSFCWLDEGILDPALIRIRILWVTSSRSG